MSKFTKQAKIKDRQADYWMTVCHEAMRLFPEQFPFTTEELPKPGESAQIIVKLLKELALRRIAAKDEVAHLHHRLGLDRVVFDEQSPFTGLPKCGATIIRESVNARYRCSLLKGHRGLHSFGSFIWGESTTSSVPDAADHKTC